MGIAADSLGTPVAIAPPLMRVLERGEEEEEAMTPRRFFVSSVFSY